MLLLRLLRRGLAGSVIPGPAMTQYNDNKELRNVNVLARGNCAFIHSTGVECVCLSHTARADPTRGLRASACACVCQQIGIISSGHSGMQITCNNMLANIYADRLRVCALHIK